NCTASRRTPTWALPGPFPPTGGAGSPRRRVTRTTKPFGFGTWRAGRSSVAWRSRTPMLGSHVQPGRQPGVDRPRERVAHLVGPSHGEARAPFRAAQALDRRPPGHLSGLLPGRPPDPFGRRRPRPAAVGRGNWPAALHLLHGRELLGQGHHLRGLFP